MNDLPRQKLDALIEEYGFSLCDDPRRLEALLKDHCAQHKREIHVLVNAARERVAADLQRNSAPASILIPQLVERLHENLGLDKEIARWGVESWAWAMRPRPFVGKSVEELFSLGWKHANGQGVEQD